MDNSQDRTDPEPLIAQLPSASLEALLRQLRTSHPELPWTEFDEALLKEAAELDEVLLEEAAADPHWVSTSFMQRLAEVRRQEQAIEQEIEQALEVDPEGTRKILWEGVQSMIAGMFFGVGSATEIDGLEEEGDDATT
jgi:hypothetical protein